MRIGIIVDGASERAALPNLTSRLSDIPNLIVVGYVLANVSATAEFDTIVNALETSLRVLAKQDPQRVIVLWDREQRIDCPTTVARHLQNEIDRRRRRYEWAFTVDVVIKDRMFENWLVAALPAIQRTQGTQARFHLSRADTRAIIPNKADHVDALALLKKSITHGQYEKVADSKRILAAADATAMAANSRSFRRFLRCRGHPDYLSQSKSPQRV